MYDSYARLYAAIGQPWVGLHALATVHRWLDAYGWRGTYVVDLGCGTGDVAVALALKGLHVVGVDQSAAMLAFAQRHAAIHAANVYWIQEDLTSWQSSKPVDLVLSFYDTLNYILEPTALQQTFQHVASALAADGVFAFDLNTPLEYATWIERSTVTADSDDVFVYNVLDFDESSALATGKIVWFERQATGWQRGSETHTQRAYSDHEISTWLDQAGLTIAARLTLDGAPADVTTATRILYIVQRTS